MRTLGIIGGSGLYQMPGLGSLQSIAVDTPYGTPSAPLLEATLDGVRLLFLARHGQRHHIPPHQINYRANICALKKAGAEQVVSVSAVGSLSEEIAPGDVVIVDQYIDLTRSRATTFFEDGLVAHVSMAEPVCVELSAATFQAAHAAGARVHRRGTYLCIEGPQFSTRAESNLYRSWGVSVIGMTALPEAKLAREAQLPYATIAFSTDYDCWREAQEAVSVQSVLAVMKQNSECAHAVLRALPALLPDPNASPAAHALKHAIINHDAPPPEVAARLSWLLG